MAPMPTTLATPLLLFNHLLMAWAFASHLAPHEYTLVLHPFLALLAYYACARALVECAGGPLAVRLRRRSWLLAAAASALLSALGAPVAYALLAAPAGELEAFVTSDPPHSRAALCFFGVFMLLDLLVGFLDYRELVDPLTGYAHHTFFLLAGVWTLASRSCGFFLAMAIVEVPTLLLGLGALHSQLHSDLAFGASFALLRLAYTAWFTLRMWGVGGGGGGSALPAALGLIMLPVCLLHVVWFSTWLTAAPAASAPPRKAGQGKRQ